MRFLTSLQIYPAAEEAVATDGFGFAPMIRSHSAIAIYPKRIGRTMR